MQRINLDAIKREILGKKVKLLRKDGKLPAHVFGKNIETEHVTVDKNTFTAVFNEVGETGLIDLKVDQEKIRPVLVRDVQYDPINSGILHIDFYQVNLAEKVKVPVPIQLVGEEPEKVHLGEVIVLQTISEVEVEALPTDLIEKLEVDISTLKEVGDAIAVSDLNYDHSKINILVDSEEIVVKLAPAVTAEMEKLLQEQATEAAEAQTEQAVKEETAAEEVIVEGDVKKETGDQVPEEGGVTAEAQKEVEKPPEDSKKE